MQCFSLRTFVIWEFYLALFDGIQIKVGFQHLLRRGNAGHRLHCREKYPAHHVLPCSLLSLCSWHSPLAPVQEQPPSQRGGCKSEEFLFLPKKRWSLPSLCVAQLLEETVGFQVYCTCSVMPWDAFVRSTWAPD